MINFILSEFKACFYICKCSILFFLNSKHLSHICTVGNHLNHTLPFSETYLFQYLRFTSNKCTHAQPNAHAPHQASAPTRTSPFTGTSPSQRLRSTSSKCTHVQLNAHAPHQASAPTRTSPFTGTSPSQRPRSASSKCTHDELSIYLSNSSHLFVKAPYQHSTHALNSNNCLISPHLSRAVLKRHTCASLTLTY